jgi:hypothetical protein
MRIEKQPIHAPRPAQSPFSPNPNPRIPGQ